MQRHDQRILIPVLRVAAYVVMLDYLAHLVERTIMHEKGEAGMVLMKT